MNKVTEDNVIFDKELGSYFKCLRMDLGLSVEDLSNKCDLSESVICDLEDGRQRFTIMIIRKFCRALRISCGPIEGARSYCNYNSLREIFDKLKRKRLSKDLNELVGELDNNQMSLLIDYCKQLKAGCEDVRENIKVSF